MLKKGYSIVFSIIVVSLFLCSGSFAQYINVSPDLEFYAEWSTPPLSPPAKNINLIKDRLTSQEQAIFNTLPPYQQSAYNYTKDKLKIGGTEGRLALLESIKVYVARSGVDFETIRLYYKDLAEGPDKTLYLEDLEKVADSRNITERREKLRLVLNKIPDNYFPTSADKDRLMNYIDYGALTGFIGTSIESGSEPPKGQSNISIQPIYVDPETYAVHDYGTDGRTAWVIISTYSKVFERPPLLRTPTPTSTP